MPRGSINHQELRVQFRAKVTNILNHLRTFSQWILKVDDLMRLGIDIAEFDPFDLNESIIFQPLPAQELKEYDIDEIMLRDDTSRRLLIPDWTPPKSANEPPTRREQERHALRSAQQVYEWLEAMYSSMSKTYEPFNSLSMIRNWIDIPIPHPEFTFPAELGRNSWPRDTGMLSYDSNPHHVGWRYEMVSEWKDRPPRGEPKTRPHVRMVVCHGHVGDPNGLLIGELGAIAQVIFNRLNQPSFVNESYFPVLLISLFGPRHGRILQAVYRRSGRMELRLTRVHDLTKMVEAPLDLYLRYLASYPRRDDY